MTDWDIARGYRFAGIHCGLRASEPGRLDLALIVSDLPAAAAGVYTQNRVCAAPVQVCRERLPRADAKAVVICSGNANACTGEQGFADALKMASLAADALGCDPQQVVVCSTGVIGRLLPMEVFETGIPDAVREAQPGPVALERAARAILTTDTRPKVHALCRRIEGSEICVTGFAKGAAMIGPNMATMLGFLVTDACVEPRDLREVLSVAVDHTFNCISVEGHTSTNDTVLLLANGEGTPLRGHALRDFAEAVTQVCAGLAKDIAADAEGAEHLIVIEVEGTRDDMEARRVAKAIADSALVKAAVFGTDPNWGRVVSAAGYAGVDFVESNLSLWMGELPLYLEGTPQPFDHGAASAYLKNNREVRLKLVFTLGTGRCTFHTCDLTPEYIRLNADYTT